MMKHVYFDNAATTSLREEVITAMTGVLQRNYGNPSSSHSFGRTSKALIEKARKTIAEILNVTSSEIFFTSGGTEADNLVLRSAIRDLGVEEIITTRIEHHAVLNTLVQLQKEYNLNVKYVNLDSDGHVDYNDLEKLISNSEKKQLVSLMHINNEIGTILDIKRVAALCEANQVLFHSDAVQSIGHFNIDLQDVKVDFLAASAHKFHGPKGIGFVFVRKNSGLNSLMFGGEQERGLRAGTESIHNIVGLEVAIKQSYLNIEKEASFVEDLKKYFLYKIKLEIPNVAFNGRSDNLKTSTYTMVNVRLPISPEKASMILFQLDLKGIACSKGSACQSGSNKASHVLFEILKSNELLLPSLRFSFSIFNTKEDVDYVIDVLKSMC